MLNVYLASSWATESHPAVHEALVAAKFNVYDYRHPGPKVPGFAWAGVGLTPKCTPREFLAASKTESANGAFKLNVTALFAADIVVLLLPSNRSAHLEAGLAIGMGKPVHILVPDEPAGTGWSPELMYGMAEGFHVKLEALIEHLVALSGPKLALPGDDADFGRLSTGGGNF